MPSGHQLRAESSGLFFWMKGHNQAVPPLLPPKVQAAAGRGRQLGAGRRGVHGDGGWRGVLLHACGGRAAGATLHLINFKSSQPHQPDAAIDSALTVHLHPCAAARGVIARPDGCGQRMTCTLCFAHNLVQMPDGRAVREGWAWGINEKGQLGLGHRCTSCHFRTPPGIFIMHGSAPGTRFVQSEAPLHTEKALMRVGGQVDRGLPGADRGAARRPRGDGRRAPACGGRAALRWLPDLGAGSLRPARARSGPCYAPPCSLCDGRLATI